MEYVGLAVVVLVLAVLIARALRSRHATDDTTALDRQRPAPPRVQDRAPGDRPREREDHPPLGDQVDPAIRPLVRELSSDLPLVVARAAQALGESGNLDAIVPLIQALGRDQRSIQFAVVEALLSFARASVVPLRQALETERDKTARKAMELVLGELERRADGQPYTPTATLLEMPPEVLDKVLRDMTR